MGSLASRPKVPASPQVVYVPSPAPVVTSTTVQEPAEAAQIDATQEAAQGRKTSLLARERGRFGTVKTGFRGLMALAQNGQARKTLLGE